LIAAREAGCDRRDGGSRGQSEHDVPEGMRSIQSFDELG
jgi:hypothetical protein